MKHSNVPTFTYLITALIQVKRDNDIRNDRHPDVQFSKILLEVDNMALGQVFLVEFQLSVVIIISPLSHMWVLFICCWCCFILAVDNAMKQYIVVTYFK
jgi:hypothetical protein